MSCLTDYMPITDTPPDDITATCISNGSDSLIVAVNYTSGCRRETVVEANRAACISVSQSPRTAVFQCVGLRPSTSYNITAVDSDGHVDSLTCSTAKKEEHLSKLAACNCFEAS